MNKATNLTKLLNRLLETKAEVFKLGVDVHARDVVVCVQMDGAKPERPQRMSAAELVQLVAGLVAARRQVHICQECGPCGYSLHRALALAGAKRKQKTDGLDATALADKLDRYVRGNTKALTAITVPTQQQENQREEARLREQLKRSRHQWEARGRSLLLFKGHHVTGQWWTERRWAELKPALSPWLVRELEVMRDILLKLDARHGHAVAELSRSRYPWPGRRRARC